MKKIIDVWFWIMKKLFNKHLYSSKDFKKDVEFETEPPKLIEDEEVYITKEQAYYLKEQMKNDIEIGKRAISKAEDLYNGKIGIYSEQDDKEIEKLFDETISFIEKGEME